MSEPSFRDEVRATVSPHKFGGDRMAAACWLLSMDGMADEETGDAVDWQYHAARFGRRILYTDTQGFVWVDKYADSFRAARAFEADERSYGEYLDQEEAESEAYRDGFRESSTVTIDRFFPGDTVRVEGYEGIAFRVDGLPVRHLPDYEWSGIFYQNPEQRTCHMVGDDAEYVFDIDELIPLDDDDYCSECGQIGCKGDRL